ncbi:non-specific riboncleoside hydrolase [Ligilactobacillus sp. WC1T17]|uniref:Non-specific riboncleoside hydrolase n=1 Tax=Ligilactobacillus ruminis TaxID=1623 RepID=A0ABY1AC58_9LACO|nr:non-specific riboncleoside hydrolase [Ligilactobacillus ruminis]
MKRAFSFYSSTGCKSATEAFWVDVVCEGPAKGATVADIRHAYHNKTNATVCLGVDQEAFNDWLLNEVKNNM